MKLQAGPSSPPPGRLLPVAVVARHADKILVLFPLAFLIWVVSRYAVAVPFWDQWELVPLLDKTYHGALTFPDLWAQHNEHRPIVPKIIMLGLARLTHWDIRYELALNLLLGVAIFAVLIHQLKITCRKAGAGELRWAGPAIALIVFSGAQYQNWLWGWQIQMFLNLLAVGGGTVLLARENFRWWRFGCAALLGVVANYSFANGLLFWPIGLCILFVVTSGTKTRRAALVGWTLISILTLASYFYHYQKPADLPPLNLVFKMPLEFIAFVLKYTGNLGAQGVTGNDAFDGDLALAIGLAVLVALIWTVGSLLRRRVADVRTLLPYLGMSLYSLGSALMTGVGRVGLGSNQAFVSRYGTMMVPLWATLVVFLFMLRDADVRTGETTAMSTPGCGRSSPDICRVIAGWSLLAVIAAALLGSICALDGARLLSRAQAYGCHALLNLAAHPGSDADYRGLSLLYPRTDVLLQRYPVLVQHQLSVFRAPPLPADSP